MDVKNATDEKKDRGLTEAPKHKAIPINLGDKEDNTGREDLL